MGVILASRASAEEFEFVRHVGEPVERGHLTFQFVDGHPVGDADDRTAATTDEETETLAGGVEEKMGLPTLKLQLTDDLDFHEEHQRSIDGGIIESTAQFCAAADGLQCGRHRGMS
jgi:hypothetical protein